MVLLSKQDISVDEDKLAQLLSEYRTESASFTEMSTIGKILPYISQHVPIDDATLRKLFLIAMVRYRNENHTQLQKVALLDNEERFEAVNALRNNLLKTIVNVLHTTKTTPGELKSFLAIHLDIYFKKICTYLK